MPRLRNATTGVVVNVSDEKAARLAPGWVGLDEPAAKSAPATVAVTSVPASSNGTSAEVPAGNASQQVWADWVVGNVQGVDEAEVRALPRNDLREKYGPKPE